MPHWFKRAQKEPVSYDPPPGAPPPPPAWSTAPERSHTWGLVNEAAPADYAAATQFCTAHPPAPARLLDSDTVAHIRAAGAAAWGLAPPGPGARFVGELRGGAGLDVVTNAECGDCTLLSVLPLVGALYARAPGQAGVYYEARVARMDAGATVALGAAAAPYPPWRLPGWHRLSAALHLDDMRKFSEDSDGGRDYAAGPPLAVGDVFGLGYEFADGGVFFTRNGVRLPRAFAGAFMAGDVDVYAALGVAGCTEVRVNFGAEPFVWAEANAPAWRVERHVGVLDGGAAALDELPAYSAR